MLSQLLITIAKQHKDRMAELLRSLDLYVGQDIFLLTLAHYGELTQTELKDRLQVEYSTIHKIAARLEKRGLVEKKKGGSDQRVSVIHLSGKGKKVSVKIGRFWEELEEEFFSSLNEGEKSDLRQLLEKLKA